MPIVELIESIVKDIAGRYRIRNTEKLRLLAKFYLTNIAHSITYSSVSRFTRLPVKTIERFSEYMAGAYLLFFVKRFSFSIKEQENSPRKVYAADNGMAVAAGFNTAIGKGALVENAIATELARRGMETYYWKNPTTGREVDFVVKEGKRYRLIQAAESIDEPNALDREAGALRSAMKRLGRGSCSIITNSAPRDSTVRQLRKAGVRIEPIWKFLLSDW